MTMWQHTLLGSAILLLLWYGWLHRYFYTPKNLSDIDDEIDKWLNKE